MRDRLSTLRRNWFLITISLIGLVSLYDTWLIFQFRSVIDSTEENPVGRWLIEIGHGDVGVFIRAKLAGTLCVLSTLCALQLYRSRFVMPVTTSVASYQTGLFFYLTLA